MIRGRTLPAPARITMRSGGPVRQERATEHREAGGVTPSNVGPPAAPRPPADGERVNDITQKLCCWGDLSHFRDAECDVAWLLEKLAERDARIVELETKLRETAWILSLP